MTNQVRITTPHQGDRLIPASEALALYYALAAHAEALEAMASQAEDEMGGMIHGATITHQIA